MLPIVLGMLLTLPGQLATPRPAYRIVIEPAKRYEATLSTDLTLPNATVQEWLILAPKPPDLPSQKLTKATVDPACKEAKDLSPRERTILTTRVPVKDKKNQTMLTATAKYEIALFSRELVPLLASDKPPVIEPLSEAERSWYTSEGGVIDWRHEMFFKWYEKQELKRQEKEDDIAFARRIFLTIRANVKAGPIEGNDYKASVMSQQATVDPAGRAILFVACCRAGGLPARLLVGRGALSAKPDNNMMYVKAEFFAAGVGWVPVDVNYNRFGDDEANFIVLHVDTDVVLDVPREKRKLEWFHFIHVGPTQGKGKPDGAVVKEDWLVKELRQP